MGTHSKRFIPLFFLSWLHYVHEATSLVQSLDAASIINEFTIMVKGQLK